MATYIPFLGDNSNDVSGAYYPQDFSLNALNFVVGLIVKLVSELPTLSVLLLPEVILSLSLYASPMESSFCFTFSNKSII